MKKKLFIAFICKRLFHSWPLDLDLDLLFFKDTISLITNNFQWFNKFFDSICLYSRSSRPQKFCKKSVPRNFAKSAGKHPCQSPFFNKVEALTPTTLLKKRLWHRCFPVNFTKFLRTAFSQTNSGGCFLNCWILMANIDESWLLLCK